MKRKQRLIIWATGVAVAAACLVFSTRYSATLSQASGVTGLEPKSGSWQADIGVVPFGKRVPHVFEFENNSSEPLRVLRVRADCTCHEYDFSDDWVAPGGNGELAVVVDVRSVAKRFQSYFHVIGESPSSGEILLGTFVLKAEIEQIYWFYVEPRMSGGGELAGFGEVPALMVLDGTNDLKALDGIYVQTPKGQDLELRLEDAYTHMGPNGPQVRRLGVVALPESIWRSLPEHAGLIFGLPEGRERPALGARLSVSGPRRQLGPAHHFLGALLPGSSTQVVIDSAYAVDLSSAPPWMQLSREKANPDGDAWRVTISADAPRGAFSCVLDASSTDVLDPKLLIGGIVR